MFRDLLKNDYIIFDGAMGTMLQAAGMKMGETPEVLSITEPELLIDIHTKYINAGAQIIYANTFGANAYKLEGEIDMLESYTFVEVPKKHADKVLEAMENVKIKGRTVNIEKASSNGKKKTRDKR